MRDMKGTDGRWQYKKLELSALGRQYNNFKYSLHAYYLFDLLLPTYVVVVLPAVIPCVFLPL